MIREWWARHMDARRALAAALTAVALLLCVAAMAAAPGFATSGTGDPGGFAKYSAALGGASGFGLRAYLLHRKSGLLSGLRSAVVEGGAMALLLLGMFVLAFVIRPSASSNEVLDGDAWMGILAIGVVLSAVAGVLWERNDRRRRIAVAFLVAVGFIAGGILVFRVGGAASAIGTVALVVGIVALCRAWLRGFQDLKREMAETSETTV